LQAGCWCIERVDRDWHSTAEPEISGERGVDKETGYIDQVEFLVGTEQASLQRADQRAGLELLLDPEFIGRKLLYAALLLTPAISPTYSEISVPAG